jgi:FkbM family methyltransferase
MCAKINRELARLIPEGPVKDILTGLYYSVYYNPKHFKDNGFLIYYRKSAFEFAFESGVRIRACLNLEDEIRRSLLGYIAKHAFKEGEVALDCGAEAGEFAIYAAKAVGPSGRVVIFEPDPLSVEIIKKNIALNGLSNVTLINKGVWNSDAALLYDDKTKMLAENGSVKVSVVSIDNEMRRLGIEKVDFIKMDVEGAEVEAIKGSAGMIKKCRPDLAIASYHDIGGRQSRYELEDILAGMGYSVQTGHPRHITTYATKK